MLAEDAVYIRAVTPHTTLWSVYAVNGAIEEGADSTEPDLRKGSALPAPAALARKTRSVRNGRLCVELMLPARKHLDTAPALVASWLEALFAAGERPEAERWLMRALAFTAQRRQRLPIVEDSHWANERSVFFSQWTYLIVTGDYELALVPVFAVSHRDTWLAVWTRPPRSGHFISLQRHLAALYELGRAGGRGAAWSLSCAHQRLQLASVGVAADMLGGVAARCESDVLRLLAEPGGSARSITSRRRVQQEISTLAGQVGALNQATIAAGRSRFEIAHLDVYEPDGRSPLPRNPSPAAVSESIATAQAALRQALHLFSVALSIEEDARAAEFQSIATVVTSLLLVPALIAGVFGANVDVPGHDTRDGFWAMLAWMTGGGVTTWAVMRWLQRAPIVPLGAPWRRRVAVAAGICGAGALFLAATLPQAGAETLRYSLIALGALIVVIALAIGLQRQIQDAPF